MKPVVTHGELMYPFNNVRTLDLTKGSSGFLFMMPPPSTMTQGDTVSTRVAHKLAR